MSTFTIPASLDEAVGQLEGIERLLTAKRWERAAILAAFVEIGEHGENRHTKRTLLSSRQFAALGIAGLKSHMTVREYVRRWLEDSGRPRPKPGQVIDLNGLPEWDKPEPGTKYLPGKEGAEERVKDQPSTVTAALDDEQFRAKVVASMDYEQRRKLSNEITDQEMARIEERQRREGVKDVALLPEQINAKEHREGHRRITDKLHQILFLIQEVNHDWAEFEGTFHLEMVQSTINDLKVELGLLEFYADLTVDGDDPRVPE